MLRVSTTDLSDAERDSLMVAISGKSARQVAMTALRISVIKDEIVGSLAAFLMTSYNGEAEEGTSIACAAEASKEDVKVERCDDVELVISDISTVADGAKQPTRDGHIIEPVISGKTHSSSQCAAPGGVGQFAAAQSISTLPKRAFAFDPQHHMPFLAAPFDRTPSELLSFARRSNQGKSQPISLPASTIITLSNASLMECANEHFSDDPLVGFVSSEKLKDSTCATTSPVKSLIQNARKTKIFTRKPSGIEQPTEYSRNVAFQTIQLMPVFPPQPSTMDALRYSPARSPVLPRSETKISDAFKEKTVGDMAACGRLLQLHAPLNPDAMAASSGTSSGRVPLSHASHGHICKECGKVFKSRHTLKFHSSVHDGTTHQCQLCKRVVKSLTDYRNHMRLHSGHEGYQCCECRKCFPRQCELKRHIKIVHMQERPYKCELCGLSFATRWNLKCHDIKRHISSASHVT